MKHPHIRKLRKFWKPKNRRNRKQEGLLREAMKACGVRERSLTFFLYHPKFAPHRSKVVKRLNP
jgi:hypothetical protein